MDDVSRARAPRATRGRPGTSRPRRPRSRLTPARLPAEAQAHCPPGLVGEDLGDWYLTWDAGRRHGEAALAPLAAVVARLEALADRLAALSVGQAPPAQGVPRGRRADRPAPGPDPFDPDAAPAAAGDVDDTVLEPDVPAGVQLPGPEYQRVLDWISWAEGQATRPRDVGPAVHRILAGYRYNPATGAEEHDPPWTVLLSRWDDILYTRLAGQGLLPPPPEEILTLPAGAPR